MDRLDKALRLVVYVALTSAITIALMFSVLQMQIALSEASFVMWAQNAIICLVGLSIVHLRML